MILPDPSNVTLRHVSTVTHEGKLLVFAACTTLTNSNVVTIFYTVRRDGFEDRADTSAPQLATWENWKSLPLLDDTDDQSVIDNEKKTLSVQAAGVLPAWVSAAPAGDPVRILQSIYQSDPAKPGPKSAVAPVQVLSAQGHIYTFRVSTRNTVLVDRFVLDGLTNTLIRKLDVRFKRSRQRLTPLTSQGSSAAVIDALDFRDANGKPFYEPAIELVALSLSPAFPLGALTASVGPTDTSLHLSRPLSQALPAKTRVRLKPAGQGPIDLSILADANPGESALFINRISTPIASGTPISALLVPGLAVIYVEGSQPDLNYWHFFVLNGKPGQVEVTSIRASQDGLFDVQDKDGNAGILRRVLVLSDASGAPLNFTGVPAAICYDKQHLAKTRDGDPQLLRDSTHAMLTISAGDAGIVSVSLAVTTDGTLAELAPQPDPATPSIVLHSSSEEVTLAPNALDDIQPVDPLFKVATGTITSITVTPDGATVLGLATDDGGPVPDSGSIRIDASGAYNGSYAASSISLGTLAQGLASGSTTLRLATALKQALPSSARLRVNAAGSGPTGSPAFQVTLSQPAALGAVALTITAAPHQALSAATVTALDLLEIAGAAPQAPTAGVTHPLGTWIQVLTKKQIDAQQPGAKISALSLETTGKLLLAVPGNTINGGGVVQIEGAQILDGVHTFSSAGAGAVRLAESVDAGRVEQFQPVTRTGLQFNGAGDFITVAGSAFSLERDFTLEAWINTATDGVISGRVPAFGNWANSGKVMCIAGGKLSFVADAVRLSSTTSVADGKFHHLALVNDATRRTLTFYIDGQLDSAPLFINPPDAAGQEIHFGFSAPAFPSNAKFTGTLAEVRVWEIARSQRDIVNAMNPPLTGSEDGLAGYWRLTSIVEGDPRTVTDFTPRGNHGTVHGDPFVFDAALSRDLGNNRLASGFVSDVYFAAEEGGAYEESFEFELDAGTAAVPPKPFDFHLFGKTSADDTEKPADFQPVSQPPQPVFDIQPGRTFQSVTCRFVVPQGMTFVRAFGIGNAQGTWTTLRIRRHHIRLVSSSITESRVTDAISIPASTSQAARAAGLSAAYEELELSEALLLSGQVSAGPLLDQVAALSAQLANPVNYWCHIQGGGGQMLLARSTTGSALPFLENQIPAPADDPSSTVVRFEPVTQQGGLTVLQPGRGAVSPVGDFVPLTNTVSSRDEARSALELDLNDESQRPLLALAHKDRQNVPISSATPMLDPASVRSRLSTASNARFDSQQTDPGARRFLGIDPGQIWSLRNINPRTTLVTGGQINFSQVFLWDVDLTRPEQGNPGDSGFLAAVSVNDLSVERQHVFVVGNEADLVLQMPAISIDSEVAAGEVPRAGRPVSEDVRKELITIRTKLNLVLAKLQDLGFSGVNPIGQPLDQRISSVRAALATAKQAFLSQRTAVASAISAQTLTASGVPRISVSTPLPAPSTGCRLDLLDSGDAEVKLTLVEREDLTLQVPAGIVKRTNFEFRQVGYDTASDAWTMKPLPTCLNLILAAGGPGFLEIRGGPQLTAGWSAECWVFLPLAPAATFLQLAGAQGGTLTLPTFQITGPTGNVTPADFDVSILGDGWHHFAVTAAPGSPNGTSTCYVDGESVGEIPLVISGQLNRIGDPGSPIGKLAEVRVWSSALTAEEIQSNYLLGVSGREPELVGFYPLDGSTDNQAVGKSSTELVVPHNVDLVAGMLPFPTGRGRLSDPQAIVPSAAISGEYATFAVNPATGQNTAWLRRFIAVPGTGGIHLFSQKRVEELELVWIGNAQFAPTLLGYIEGAPPVPSENLTINPDSYAGATSIELDQSDEVDYTWNQSKESTLGSDFEFFLGAEAEVETGAAVLEFIGVKTLSFKLGARGSLALARSENAESSVTSAVTISTNDKVSLRGHVESQAKFAPLAPRFIPKNVGYALVISALGDVFITRLKQSGKMISYTVVPTPDVPPDINTISFLINPAYTLNGSLDGLVGSRPADDRFYRNVADMRARQGSLFPASYLRLREAFDLKQQIDAADKRRESFFLNFDTSLAFGIPNQSDDLLPRVPPSGEDTAPITLNPAPGAPAGQDAQTAKLDHISDQIGSLTSDVKSQQSQQDTLIRGKQQEIQQQIQDPQSQVHALRSFDLWQQKMDDLRIKAGKRNIVNSYVWDANGGLRSEAQQVATTVEHSIGSSVSLDASLGLESEFGVAGVSAELNAAFKFSMSQTLSKKLTTTHALSLNIEASGVEGLGVTDDQDLPLLPGEKVERYRFMSFYLEPSLENFSDFFAEVVDPEWLASNDEDARALRQTQAGKPNRTWRVLHRVTFVERPALAGFGREAVPESPEFDVESAIQALQLENVELRAKLDQIIALLGRSASGAGA